MTGDEKLGAGARNFWETVARHRSYVIGGNSDGEMFTATNRLGKMGPNTTETCNTYNMLKLTRHLFCWEPKEEYAEYYERALCNHILASQNPESGMMCYYVPLRNGSRKNFNSPNDDFWCCTGTGVENHGKYGDSVYFHDDDKTLYVNLFIASELTWKAKGLKLRQETRYPEEQMTRLVLTCEQPRRSGTRAPAPLVGRLGLRDQGERRAARGGEQTGSYAEVSRSWKTGDTLEIACHSASTPRVFMTIPAVLRSCTGRWCSAA